MELKKIRAWEIACVACALLVVLVFCFHHPTKSQPVPDDQIPGPDALPSVLKPSTAATEGEQRAFAAFHEASKPLPASDEEDEALKELKDQMEADRNQQRQIKMLKMQLEQESLQLESQKAMAEIDKLKKEDTGTVKVPAPAGNTTLPSVKVIYIAGTESKKEAIVSIGGTNYSVKEKDRPTANVEVISITNSGVKLRFSAPEELTTVINYEE